MSRITTESDVRPFLVTGEKIYDLIILLVPGSTSSPNRIPQADTVMLVHL